MATSRQHPEQPTEDDRAERERSHHLPRQRRPRAGRLFIVRQIRSDAFGRSADRVLQLRAGRKTMRRVLGHQAHREQRPSFRCVRDHVAGIRDRIAHMHDHGGAVVGSPVGRAAREQVPQGCAQGILIAAVIHGLGPRLLRAHVQRRAHDLQAALLIAILLGQGLVRDRLGQAQIRQFHRAIVAEHDVVRLDVAVDDAFLFGVAEGRRHPSHDFGDQRDLKRSLAIEHRLHRFALDQLHRKAVKMLDALGAQGLRRRATRDIVDVNDRWVVEATRRARLVDETLGESGVLLGQGRRENFERHDPLHRDLAGAVDLAHAAATEQAENLIAADHSSCRQHRPGSSAGTGSRLVGR